MFPRDRGQFIIWDKSNMIPKEGDCIVPRDRACIFIRDSAVY
jgi:hypothetical protein